MVNAHPSVKTAGPLRPIWPIIADRPDLSYMNIYMALYPFYIFHRASLHAIMDKSRRKLRSDCQKSPPQKFAARRRQI